MLQLINLLKTRIYPLRKIPESFKTDRDFFKGILIKSYMSICLA
jgi:hypothetical protein